MAEPMEVADNILRWGDEDEYLEIWVSGEDVHFSRIMYFHDGEVGDPHTVAQLSFKVWDLQPLSELAKLLDAPFEEAETLLRIDSDPVDILTELGKIPARRPA